MPISPARIINITVLKRTSSEKAGTVFKLKRSGWVLRPIDTKNATKDVKRFLR